VVVRVVLTRPDRGLGDQVPVGAHILLLARVGDVGCACCALKKRDGYELADFNVPRFLVSLIAELKAWLGMRWHVRMWGGLVFGNTVGDNTALCRPC
jgi:hypothetical protein